MKKIIITFLVVTLCFSAFISQGQNFSTQTIVGKALNIGESNSATLTKR